MKHYTRAIKWAMGYIGAILVFALLYWCLPKDNWGGVDKICNFGDAFYFSVVTITSLGFGDIYPASGTVGRYLVAMEAILGILIIGFFLNDIAMSQAKHLDEVNQRKEEKKRHQDALVRLRKHFTVLTPLIAKYLRSIYEVITPLPDRPKNFPNDIMAYPFEFEMKDIGDLYKQSMLLTSGFQEPAINVYFKSQDALYEEIQTVATTADLSDWPDLLAALFKFITLHQEFQFKDAILSNMSTYLGSGSERTKYSDFISEEIKKHDGNLRFRNSNGMTPYEVLYVSLRENVKAIKEVHRLMKLVAYNN